MVDAIVWGQKLLISNNSAMNNFDLFQAEIRKAYCDQDWEINVTMRSWQESYLALAMVPFLDNFNYSGSKILGPGQFGPWLYQMVPSIKSMNVHLMIRCLVYEICSFRQRIFWWSLIFDIFKTQQAALKLLSFLV